MTSTRTIVDYQLLLTIFLAVLLWFFCARLSKLRIFRWWAWAWTAFAGYLAIGDLVLRLPPAWTLLKGSLILGAICCGYLQPTFLAYGAYAFQGHETARKTWVRVGIAMTVAAGALAIVAAFRLKHDPLSSFAARSAPRTLALSASLLYCAWVFIVEWRKRRETADIVTAISCALYGFNQGLYGLTCLRQLGGWESVPHLALPSLQIFFSPLLLFVDFVYEFGICLGTVLLLLEAHQRTERALLQSDIRADLFAESNAALQAEIAERKQAQKELDRVFDYSVDMLCVAGFDGYFKRVSPSFGRILGWSEAELLATPLFDFVHPDDRERSRLAAKTHEAGEDAINFVNRYRCKDGTYKWVSWSSHPLVEEKIVIGVARDITESKRAQETETWLASFPKLNPNPIVEVDTAGRVSFMNPAAQKFFPDLQSRGATHPWLAGLEDVARTFRASEHHEYVREIFVGEDWYEQYAYFVPSINSLRLYGFNISERKRSEAALRSSQEHLQEYERAIQGLDEMIAVVDRQYHYVIANRAFLTYRGTTNEELMRCSVPDVLGLEVFERVVRPKLDESFRGEVVKYEMKYTYPKLGERHLFLTYFPIEGPAGIDRVACVLRDVTERKLAEQAMREITGRMLRLQDEERRRIARELHDTTAQNIAAVCLNLSLLSRSAAHWGERETEVLGTCRRVADQSLRELRTASYLLHPPLLDELGLESALRWFVEGFNKRSGIQVSLDVTAGLPRLPGEVELSLFRVVQESLGNVHRHSGSKVATVRLWLDDGVVLEVEDEGVGLPDSWVESRGTASHLGVGIAGMQERMRQLGGDLQVCPRKPRGTTVHAAVPVGKTVHEAASSTG